MQIPQAVWHRRALLPCIIQSLCAIALYHCCMPFFQIGHLKKADDLAQPSWQSLTAAAAATMHVCRFK